MKVFNLLALLSLTFLCLMSCKNHTKKRHEARIHDETRINYPKDIKQIKDVLQTRLKSVIIDVFEGECAGVWKLKVQRKDSSTIFTYNILSDTLSSVSYNQFLHRVMLYSCLVDEHASKALVYKNLFFTPGCGSITDDEVKIADAFYESLISQGARETDKKFFPNDRF